MSENGDESPGRSDDGGSNLTGTYAAVCDRIEEGFAVLLLEEDERVIEEILIDAEELPAGTRGGAVLTVELEDGYVKALEFHEEETRIRRQAAQNRFDSLAQRPPGQNDSGSEDEESDVE